MGKGHNLVNCATNPRSARESAALRGRVGGSDIFGMSSNLLTNLVADGQLFAEPIVKMREVKAFAVPSFSRQLSEGDSSSSNDSMLIVPQQWEATESSRMLLQTLTLWKKEFHLKIILISKLF